MITIRARIFAYVKRSCTLVPHFTLTQLINVIEPIEKTNTDKMIAVSYAPHKLSFNKLYLFQEMKLEFHLQVRHLHFRIIWTHQKLFPER